MAKFLDFQKIKEANPIDRAIPLLNLDMKQKGKQWRGPCPRCDGSDRSLVVTPDKGAFYCFEAREGGDVIALVAHIHNVDTREAAAFLSSPQESKNDERPSGTLQPLSYLKYEHEMVQDIGISAEDAERLGIGYAPKGIMRGTVAVPIRLPNGKLAGYIGIADAVLPPSWQS